MGRALRCALRAAIAARVIAPLRVGRALRCALRAAIAARVIALRRVMNRCLLGRPLRDLLRIAPVPILIVDAFRRRSTLNAPARNPIACNADLHCRDPRLSSFFLVRSALGSPGPL